MRVLAFIVLAVLASAPASAQSFVEVEADGLLSAKLNLEKSFGETEGIFVWALANPDWAEVYGGITVKPTSWTKVTLGFGIETDKFPLRLGTTFWIGNDRISSLTILEDGGSGGWCKHTTTLKTGPVSLGLIAQTGQGWGPLVEIPTQHKFVVSGAITRHDGTIKGLVALSKSF